MPRKRFTPERIIGLLRQGDVDLANGRTVDEVSRMIGVSKQSYYRWRNEHEDLKVDVEAALTADIAALATQYGRYGYRRVTAAAT